MGRGHCCLESRREAETVGLTDRYGTAVAQLARPAAKLVATVAQRPGREAGARIVDRLG